MRRLLISWVLLALLALPAAARTDEPLTFWVVTGNIEDAEMFRELGRRFEQETGVGIRVTPLSWGSFSTKYFTAMAAGDPPDVGITNLNGPFDYGSVGGVIDLYEHFGEEVVALERDFYPGLLEIFRSGDRLYGLPAEVTMPLVYSRTDVLDDLGVSAPATLSDLDRVIRAVEADGRRFLHGWPRGFQFGLAQYTLPYGLPAFEPATGDVGVRVNWDDPAYIDAVARGLMLWYAHGTSERDTSSRTIGYFKTDDPAYQTPVIVDVSQTYPRFKYLSPELEGRWQVSEYPVADDGEPRTVCGGSAFVIFRDSDHKRDSFEWIRFLSSVESQVFMTEHRFNRGDAGVFHIAPTRTFWDQPGLWRSDELKPHEPVAAVVRDIMPRLATTRLVQGAIDVVRVEQARIVDRMANDIPDWIEEAGRRHGLSRRGMIEAFARGEHAADRQQIVSRVRESVGDEYAAIGPAMEAELRRQQADYGPRFGVIIENLSDYSGHIDVLDIAVFVVGGGLVGTIVLIASVPRVRRHWLSYAFVGTPVVLVLVFVAIPAFTALWLSFTEYHPILPLASSRWVGFEQYISAFTGSDLPASLARTVVFAGVSIPLTLGFALVIANLLNNRLMATKLWRFIYFCPLVTSIVSVSLIFTQLFRGTAEGWLNSVLLQIGLLDSPLRFIQDDDYFLACVILVSVWAGMAFNILIFLAGLQQVPASLLEAARLDGAGPVRRFWSVVIPSIVPQIMFAAIMSLIWGFQVFEPIYMLGGGAGEAGAKFGPNDSGMTLVPLVFHYGFERFRMGEASALAYVLFAIIFAITLVQLRVFREADRS